MLEDSLKLWLNMDKTRITHVNNGFIFLGHRIIRKRSRYGDMRVVLTLPKEKARNFAASLTALLSGNYGELSVRRNIAVRIERNGNIVSGLHERHRSAGHKAQRQHYPRRERTNCHMSPFLTLYNAQYRPRPPQPGGPVVSTACFPDTIDFPGLPTGLKGSEPFQLAPTGLTRLGVARIKVITAAAMVRRIILRVTSSASIKKHCAATSATAI